MVQVPTLMSLTVVPLTVHTEDVVVLKLTGNPDDETALTVTGDWASRLLASAANVIVCVAFDTVKLRLTLGAVAYVAFPPWEATTVQVPALTSETVVALTVHTDEVVVVKVTGNPDDDVALTVTGDWTMVLLASAANVM